MTGVPRSEPRPPKGRTVSLERTERQLVELSVDPWRCWVSFLVMIGRAGCGWDARGGAVVVDGRFEGGLQPQKML